MKKRVPFFIVLLLLIVACGSLPSTTTPAPAVVAAEASPTFTPIPTLTPDNSVLPTPTEGFPTFTPPTATPAVANGTYPIKFAANGTYLDVTDSIAKGVSKTYSVNAMQGQIMSVSILPQIPDGSWGYIPLQIKGADGTVLCPQSTDSECLFWRGALPSTQDYFITLTPNGDVPQFVMRVAINPPGQSLQYFQYNNPATGLSLTYPDTFAPSLPVPGNYKIQPELALHFIDTASYTKTNLGEVYLFVSSSADPQIVATCTAPNQAGGGAEQVVGNETINGYTFVHSTAEGAGAGNLYEQEIYRMVNNNICYEVIYYIHSSNIGNYPPGLVTEFDKNALLQKLYGIFSTFTLK